MATPSHSIAPVLDPTVLTYLEDLAPAPDALARRLAEEATSSGFPWIGHLSGRWLELLTRAIGGRRVFEFGSGFGYSAYWFARAVGEGGQVIGSDLSSAHLETHRRLFRGSPLADRVDIRLGDALEVFAETEGSFDVVLFDLGKESYGAALELALPRLREGGLVLADNALWGGRTARPADEGETSTRALQAFNRQLFEDSRIMASMLPVGDGLAVGLKL